MKLFFAVIFLYSIAQADYGNTPYVSFNKDFYDLSVAEKEKIVSECISYLKTEKDKLLKAGVIILSESSCKLGHRSSANNGDFDKVDGSIKFVR